MDFRAVDQAHGNSQRCVHSFHRIINLTSDTNLYSGVITYSDSPSYKPDVDMLTPVQVRTSLHLIIALLC